MTVTVVDGTNLEQIMADAGVVEAEPKVEPKEAKTAGDKPPAEAKDDADKGAEKKTDAADGEDDPDDVEDEDGTTARQKRELSAKMLKAIGKKHRQVKEAEEFAAVQYREKQAAERRAAELERALEQAKPKPQEQQEHVEPKRENFATESEYIDARVKWGVDQGIRQREAERAAEARIASVRQQYQKAAELVPDFESTVSVQMTYPRDVAAYMQDSSMFAELGYHFAKNPKELERLVSLTPVRQLVELGKIEAKLRPFGSSESSPKDGDKPNQASAASTEDTGFTPSKARSDAPVIKPLTGGEGSVEPDVRSMNIRQTIEQFQKDRKVNLHARKRH